MRTLQKKRNVHCSFYLKFSIPFVALFIPNGKIQEKKLQCKEKKCLKTHHIHVVLTCEPVLWITLDRDDTMFL